MKLFKPRDRCTEGNIRGSRARRSSAAWLRNRARFIIALALVPVSIVDVSNVGADASLSVCTGYRVDDLQDPWTLVGIDLPEEREKNCPPGQAIFSILPVTGPRRSGDRVSVWATCCPLPSGVLTNTHVSELLDCPDGFVATGMEQGPSVPEELTEPEHYRSPEYWQNRRLRFLRCTQLDPSRYILGSKLGGVQTDFETGFRTQFQAKVARGRIPPALRFGLGRMNQGQWSPATCLGLPWGAVLTGKHSKYCSDFRFRQIQYLGAPGDPPRGTPVKVFPDCLAIQNPLSAHPTCIKEEP